MLTPMGRAALAATAAGFALLVLDTAFAQAPQSYTPKAIVKFAKGGDRERTVLARVPELAPLVKGQFGIGSADFDGDGVNEVVILSLSCDNAGCPVIVMQKKGGRPSFIFSRKLGGRLALTNEKVNGYHAIAAAEPDGSIKKDATGRQLVYPLGAATTAVPAPPAVPQTPAPAATTKATAAPAQPTVLFGLPGQEYIPVCTAPSCLSPRVKSRSGIGTANAVIEGEVTVEDATAWCAQNKPRYKLCVDEEVSHGGSASKSRFVNGIYRISANCEAGKLVAIDKNTYQLAGTWPDDQVGAGLPRFTGTLGSGWRYFIQPNLGGLKQGSTTITQMARESNSGQSLAVQWKLLCPGK